MGPTRCRASPPVYSRGAKCRLSFLADAPEAVVGANEDVAVGDGWGGVAGVAEGVAGEELEGGSGLEDVGDAVVVGEVEAAVGEHGRTAMVAAEVLHPQ